MVCDELITCFPLNQPDRHSESELEDFAISTSMKKQMILDTQGHL